MKPEVAYLRRWIESSFIQTMACQLFGAKPLLESMLICRKFDHKEYTSGKFEA